MLTSSHERRQASSDLGSLLPTLGSPYLPALETNAWAAEAGTSSPLHYDAAHNVYAQLVGRRSWLLLPPEASARRLRAYPRLHPSTRQVS
jgi:hypothetical protein